MPKLMGEAKYFSYLGGTFCLFLAIGMHPAFSACNLPSPTPRLTVTLFQYHGVIDTTRKGFFSQFRGILSETIENLATRSAQSLQLRDLAKLTLLPHGIVDPPEEPANAIKTQDYWCNTASLQLLRGNLIAADGGGYVVRSRVYLGDLKGQLSQSTVSLEFPLDAKSYLATSEAHYLLLYYSLAMDYANRGANGALVAELLAAALDRVSALERLGALSGDLKDVAGAVRAAVARYAG
jgi:hypothetical protein